VPGPGRRDEAGRLIPEHGGSRGEQIQLWLNLQHLHSPRRFVPTMPQQEYILREPGAKDKGHTMLQAPKFQPTRQPPPALA
jgi:hypothetical protein